MALGGAAPSSFAPLVRRVVPAVVNITVTEGQAPAEATPAMPPELRGTPFERQFRDRFRTAGSRCWARDQASSLTRAG